MEYYQSIKIQAYLAQAQQWPQHGHHILAQYDDDSIIVYQAYRPAIGLFAIEHQYFGGEFSLNRMSWIKPNFLWMMYRSNWGRAPGQEIVLGVRLKRKFFDALLQQMVPSSFDETRYASHADWQQAVHSSNVRLQWDPDHDPAGVKCDRRAIQLGLRGEVLKSYSQHAVLEIIDMSGFVERERNHALAPYDALVIPQERVYPPAT